MASTYDGRGDFTGKTALVEKSEQTDWVDTPSSTELLRPFLSTQNSRALSAFFASVYSTVQPTARRERLPSFQNIGLFKQ